MITTEGLMIHALKRGLLIADFNVLSVGMILDYIMRYDDSMYLECNNEKEMLLATQKNFNEF